ncbi:recombination regulator RecX [Treponema pallidum subsp. endemicum]|nr:recombination regulator RecX [Treponema pallidum subsp. endemicum]
MASAVHGVDFNSVSDRRFCLCAIQSLQEDVLKLTDEVGAVLQTRLSYLGALSCPIEELVGTRPTDEQYGAVCFACRCYEAECVAVRLLARSETNAQQLGFKLLKRGFEKRVVESVFPVLKRYSWLDDTRFARAWLRNRVDSRPASRAQLLGELKRRGVSHADAEGALDLLFQEQDEETLCLRLLEKLRRRGYGPHTLQRALQRRQFSPSLVRRCLAVETEGA